MDEPKKGKLELVFTDIVEGAILSELFFPIKSGLKMDHDNETIQQKNILNHPSFPSGLSEVFVLVII